MRYRLALLACAAATGCSLGLDVPPGTAIECAAQNECPENFVCQVSLSRCVPLGYDVTPPALTENPAITPTVVGATTEVTVSFTATKTLGKDPLVTLVFGPTVQKSAHKVSSGADNTAFVYAYTPDLSEPQTAASVIILITDVAGNQAASESPAAIRFDFVPPTIVVAPVDFVVSPPPGSVLNTATSVTNGGSISITLQSDEVLADGSRVRVDGGELPFVRDGFLGARYVYKLAAFAGGAADGAHGVSFEAVDAAGNVSTTVIGTLIVDTTPPAAPRTTTQDAIIYRRAPWQQERDTRFTISAFAGAFEGGAIVAAYDAPASDPARGLLATGVADADGAILKLRLPPVDRQEVYVQVVDHAGNTSNALLVQDVDWIGGFDPNGFATPHNAFSFQNLHRGLSSSGGTRITGASLFALGTDDANVSAWTSVTMARPWKQRHSSTAPRGRFFFGAAYDSRREQVVMFGGPLDDSGDAIGSQQFDLWNGAWLQPDGGGGLPPQRFGNAMAYDSGRDRVVLYGGQNQDHIYDDTWEWDGERWQYVPVVGPGQGQANRGLTFHAMVYDQNTSRVLAFGGCKDAACTIVSNETWAFDGSAWTPVTTTSPPPPRFGHTFTESGGGLQVFAGCYRNFDPSAGAKECTGTNARRDRWELNGTTWSNISDNSEPTARAFHAAAFDGADTTYFFGEGVYDIDAADTTVYASDGSDIFVSFDSGRQSLGGAAIYHAGLRKFLFLGGIYDEGMGVAFNTDVYYVRYPALVPASSAIQPNPTVLSGLAYSPARGALVVSGGNPVISGVARGSSMSWDGGAWTDLGNFNVPDAAPNTKCLDSGGGGVSVYHAQRQTVMSVCGNRTFELGDSPSSFWQETCTTVGCRGTLPTPNAGTGAGTGGYAMAYDATAQRALLFGGGYPTPAMSRNLYAYGGATASWTTLCAAGSLTCNPPPPRRCAGMAYDAARNRTVMFGGGNAFCENTFDGAEDQSVVPLNDTWEWNATASRWTQMCTSGCIAPRPRAGAALVYDTNRARVMLVGPGYGDLWEWNGVSWRELTPEGLKPTARHSPAFGYDQQRAVLAMYGGRDNLSPNNDLWELDLDPEQRPAVAVDFDWSASGVPRGAVRSITVRVRAGGRGYTNDTSLAPDADTIGEPIAGARLERWQPIYDWQEWGSNTADVGTVGVMTMVETQNCGAPLLNRDNHIYARISTVSGAGNGTAEPQLQVDEADVTVRYTIGRNACP